MPGRDGTGPMGMGPMTGRQAGYCNDAAAPGYANQLRYAGSFGCGFGRGCGHRNMYRITGLPGWARYGYTENTTANTEAFNEKAFLRNQAELLENQLQQVKKQLSSLNEEAE